MTDNSVVDKKEHASPTIFYAKKSNENRTQSNPKSRNKNDMSAKKRVNQRDESRSKDAPSNRIETFKPRAKGGDDKSDSPWKNRFKNTEQRSSYEKTEPVDRDAVKLNKQRKEESFIYNENSCKAVFENRPEAIIKAFFTEQKAPIFKALIAYLVEHKLGYDIVSDEQLAKLAQTPHHGGVGLFVKKRKGMTAVSYFAEQTQAQAKQDCVLAIDDINNPHNLGGIARTAAFFGVNSIILRHPDIIENGAAVRVSEGGSEALTFIRGDDLVATVDQFKQEGYHVVALLPCKISAIKAEDLVKAKINHPKVVFVIFQQINAKLAEQANQVVYLSGSESMAALNISVLTGVLLSKWRDNRKK
ncbi:TrmH family RNA methyltransferase [Orbaceae bacterium ac157xtp]